MLFNVLTLLLNYTYSVLFVEKKVTQCLCLHVRRYIVPRHHGATDVQPYRGSAVQHGG